MKLRLPVIRPDQYPGLPGDFLGALSSFVSQVQDALSGRLSVKDNLSAYYKTVTLDEGDSIAIKHEADWRPGAVVVAQASDLTAAGKPPATLGNPAWSVQGDQILVHSVSGMTTAHRYSVTFLVLGS